MSQALARTATSADITRIQSMADLRSLGEVFAKSGFFSDTRDAAQAIVKIMAGSELGFPPIASMTGIYIVKGKVSLSANLIAAAIKKSGRYNYKVKQLTPEVCEIEFFEQGQSAGVSTFTKADAAKAQTQNMDKFARNMLFARAMSNGAKWYCADIFGGPVYTPDELGAMVNGEGEVVGLLDEQPTGSVIEFNRTVEPVQEAAAEPIGDTPDAELDAFLLAHCRKLKGEKNGDAYFKSAFSKKGFEFKQSAALDLGWKPPVIEAEVVEAETEEEAI